jgi:hypothetical protein
MLGLCGRVMLALGANIRLFSDLDDSVHLEKAVAGFSRYQKYKQGTELRNKSRDIVSLIVKANAAKDEKAKLVQVCEALDELLILVRIVKEVKVYVA